MQIGPLSLLLATPFRLLGRTDGRIAASLLLTAVAPALVFTLERAAVAVWHDADRRLVALTAFFGGLVVMQAWSPLATIYARLDDVVLLGAITVAVWAVAVRRPWLAGAALGVGMTLKPWGVVAFPLLLALPRREWLRAGGIAGAITVAAWLPFVIADPSTLSAVRPQVMTVPASVLALLGVPLGDAPLWVRPVQFGAALLLGSVAVARGRWAAVPLLGIALRVGLDPEVWLYYSTGLLLAALAWDLLRSPHPLPVWTLAGFVLLDVAYVAVGGDHQRAVLRLVITASVVVAIAVVPRRARPQPRPADA